MTIQEFATKHNTSSARIHMSKRDGRLPEGVFSIPQGEKILHIDESFFLKKHKFKAKVTQFNIDFYYLMSELISDTEMAKQIVAESPAMTEASMRGFMGGYLFHETFKFLDYKVTLRAWAFYLWGRRFIKNEKN